MSEDKATASDPPHKGSHPRGLYVCFSAEMWERFCYYTMRGLLTLFLIKALGQGDKKAFAIYGAYTAMVYLAPVVGGKLADVLLGYRRAVILGGVLMCLGEFLICVGVEHALYVGMGIIIVGNGFFKANISTIVGALYEEGDPRRDSGFTIFYMGINIGAVGATLVGAPIGESLSKGPMGNAGYLVGFGLAGIGMICGLAIFIFGQKRLQGVGDPPDMKKLTESWLLGMSRQTWVYVGCAASVPILYLLLHQKEIVGVLLIVALVAVLVQLIGAAIKSEEKAVLHRIFVLIVLMFFNIMFWALFEQAGSSLTMFADRNVDRFIMGWEMPASMTQFFNPCFIVLLGSVFSAMWVKLGKYNPNIPMKFGLGIVQLGFGYLLIRVGVAFVDDAFKMPLIILAMMYMLHTTGELFLSPIGLSMVTKLAPKGTTGTVMGAWFLSFSFANFAAGLLAMLTGQSGGGDNKLGDLVGSAKALIANPLEKLVGNGSAMLDQSYWDKALEQASKGLDQYVDVYTTFGLAALGVGVFLCIVSWPLNKMMHGVT